MGSPRVFHTAPPQPASNARSTIEPMFVGGADASQKGFGLSMPAKLVFKSAMLRSVNGAREPRQGECRPQSAEDGEEEQGGECRQPRAHERRGSAARGLREVV